MTRRLLVLLLSLSAGACSLLPQNAAEPESSAAQGAATTVEWTFLAQPPSGTAEGAELSLVILDPVSGLSYNQQVIPMSRLSDGRWQARASAAAGSVLRYRYTRGKPALAEEAGTDGAPVAFRLATATAPLIVQDVIAAWADQAYAGPTGRIVGRLSDASSGAPVAEQYVSAGGLSTFSDGSGEFRLDGLAPGTHLLAVLSPDGAYRYFQQEALVAAESATPAEISLQPATPIQVILELTVPEDTVQGAPLRVAGNVRQLGSVLSDLPGGMRTSAARMPTLVLVDATHYLLITQLYGGTDLRYKYTLGDGLWNAERQANGSFETRQVILPEQDVTLRDTVATWHSNGDRSLTFHVTVPSNTPASDSVGIQFNPYTWFEALPMWPLGNNEWTYTLSSPLDIATAIGYRYCRNLQCGVADDVDTVGDTALGRTIALSRDATQNDSVSAWQWMSDLPPATTVVAPEIVPRPDFETGVEILAMEDPTWTARWKTALEEIAGFGSNGVILTPTWILDGSASIPSLTFDPGHSLYRPDEAALVEEARGLGLNSIFRPVLRPSSGTTAEWWQSARRDGPWWTVWFEEYRSFVLTLARQAADTGATRLVLGGEDVAPALPGAHLQNGTLSGAPADAEARWRSLFAEVRSLYTGQIAFELEISQSLQPPPPFLDAVDLVHVVWRAPLGDTKDLSVADMQGAASAWLDQSLLALPALSGKPIVLSVEYAAVDGAATGCIPAPDGACRPAAAFARGALVDPDLAPDLTEQANAVNAVLLEAYARPQIVGFYARGYDPSVALTDESASLHGKPALDVLWYWFPRSHGQTP